MKFFRRFPDFIVMRYKNEPIAVYDSKISRLRRYTLSAEPLSVIDEYCIENSIKTIPGGYPIYEQSKCYLPLYEPLYTRSLYKDIDFANTSIFADIDDKTFREVLLNFVNILNLPNLFICRDIITTTLPKNIETFPLFDAETVTWIDEKKYNARRPEAIAPPRELVIALYPELLTHYGGNPVLVTRLLNFIFERDVKSETEFENLLQRISVQHNKTNTYFALGDLRNSRALFAYKLSNKWKRISPQFNEACQPRISLFRAVTEKPLDLPASIYVSSEEISKLIESLRQETDIYEVPPEQMLHITKFIIEKLNTLKL